MTHSLATARKWLKASSMSCDGVIAKRIDDVYRPGERAMLKIKRLRSADCVVGGFRTGTNSNYVASLLLGLYDDKGRLDHIGFTTNFPDNRAALTKKLRAISGGPGFSGDAPGGPSRWSSERSAAWTPLKPKLVVEVRYDHVTGGRFRHGAGFLRWRPDKAPRQCTRDQLNG
jgi:ATP-dependent DNA ligase